MNILTSPLPCSVMVDGKFYEINTDFKVWIEIESTFLNGNISMAQKVATMLKLCYKTLPPSIEDALFAMMSFYLCSSEKMSEKPSGKVKKSVKPIYSFKEDAPYIYSAFYCEYGIDLIKENLHWWQFMALFKGLGDDNKFCKILTWRAINIDDIKDKSQKKFIRKMKNLYKLKDMRTKEEVENEMISTLEHLF